ncbi:MAG: effector-associated domain EAD1-containing protein [Caldilineaceae bacterium]
MQTNYHSESSHEKLTGPQLEELQRALLSAYRSPSALEQVVSLPYGPAV